MWLYSFFLKLLPCLVLSVLTACLIRELYMVIKKDKIMSSIFYRLRKIPPA